MIYFLLFLLLCLSFKLIDRYINIKMIAENKIENIPRFVFTLDINYQKENSVLSLKFTHSGAYFHL